MSNSENNDYSLASLAIDTVIEGVTLLKPLGEYTGFGVQTSLNIVKYVRANDLRKIDRFICNIISADEKCADGFRKLMFPENRKKERAERIIHDIFLMDTDKKVDYFSYAGISAANPEVREIFTVSDFFRAGMILALTLKEDIDYLHNFDLNDPELSLDYNDNVQGLLSSGLMYYNGEKYRFTNFAKKLDCFALDEDNSKYGFRPEENYISLPVPKYDHLHAIWG